MPAMNWKEVPADMLPDNKMGKACKTILYRSFQFLKIEPTTQEMVELSLYRETWDVRWDTLLLLAVLLGVGGYYAYKDYKKISKWVKAGDRESTKMMRQQIKYYEKEADEKIRKKEEEASPTPDANKPEDETKDSKINEVLKKSLKLIKATAESP